MNPGRPGSFALDEHEVGFVPLDARGHQRRAVGRDRHSGFPQEVVDARDGPGRAVLKVVPADLRVVGHPYATAADGRDAIRSLSTTAPIRLRLHRDGRTRNVRYTAPAKPPENVPGVRTRYGFVEVSGGARLRTIVTRPAGASGPLPAILFVDWLACSTVELPASNTGGWADMMRGVVQRSQAVVMRTDKAGVGDSEGGPCAALDYVTNLNHHKAVLQKLVRHPGVDPKKVFIFGASMGGNMAPLIAAGYPVAGVIVWGGGARTWYERTLAFERNRREHGEHPSAELGADMKRIARFLSHYLLEQKTPAEIARRHPALARVWSEEIRGTRGATMYGRPVAFHHQAQQQNWAAAWDRLRAPVLVMFGEYDWFEDAGGHALIARIVNRNVPGAARYVVFPGMNHHFELYSNPRRAVAEEHYEIGARLVVDEVVDWMNDVLATRSFR